MKNETLSDYLINGKIDIDRILDDFYNYVYVIVKNGVSVSITEEDIEEIISDVFVYSDRLEHTARSFSA